MLSIQNTASFLIRLLGFEYCNRTVPETSSVTRNTSEHTPSTSTEYKPLFNPVISVKYKVSLGFINQDLMLTIRLFPIISTIYTDGALLSLYAIICKRIWSYVENDCTYLLDNPISVDGLKTMV